MKRIVLGVLSLIVLMSMGTPVGAAVNDFTISDYQIDYYLGKDDDGRSTLRTIERITAQFPDYDQNHGIERAIPREYDGHSVSLNVESVTDEHDNRLTYETYGNGKNEVVRIGDADKYVHGTRTYVITYTQRDVTRYFADTGLDEFYWDTNGVDWRVPISALTVRLHFDEDIQSYLRAEDECYVGGEGSNARCEIEEGEGVYTVRVQNLGVGDNVTLAVGFSQGAFASYKPSLWERLVGYWIASLVVTAFLSLAIGAWLAIRWSRLRNRTNETSTIVPEYVPPRGTSVTAAAEVLDLPHSTMTAQILDLAVRHYLKVYETKPKALFKKAEYDLEIVKKIDDLNWEEQELIRDLFAGTVDVGTRMSMKTLSSSTAFYGRIQNNAPTLKKKIRGEYGLREKHPESSRWFKKTGYVLLISAVLLLSPFLLVAAILSFVLGATLWRLSDAGLALRRYLLGLKDYISVAETERLKFLQSPEGAEKVGEPVDTKNRSQLVKLYERVLPYAVLFGQEKQWSQQLGEYYEATKSQPDWYRGASGFHAANFASTMSGFSSSTSYASPSSSSSGGSGGGGFSGGGGGGGGGGGW